MSVWQIVHPTNARFFLATGAVFSDYTAEAASEATDDIKLGAEAGDPPATGDYFAIGWSSPFDSATITVSVAFVGTSGLLWQYWDGSAWTALPDLVDGTSGLTAVGTFVVGWTVPSDWAQNSVDGVAAYHIRLLWSPWTSTTTAARGTIISVQGLTTDPVYGDNPLDPTEMWNETFRPPLVLDPEWLVWRDIWTAAQDEILASQWLTRWRRSVPTAVGVQLETRGAELNYPQPDGWTTERYQAVLTALLAASWTQSQSDVVYNLATALLDDGQSFTFVEEFPSSARFTFLNTSADDAAAYISALDRARPKGSNYVLVAHPGGLGPDPFTIDTSTIDGPDTLADLFML